MIPEKNARWAVLAVLFCLFVSSAGQTSQSSDTNRDIRLNAGKHWNLSESSPYAKWLNEDVVYIISVQERAAFLKLHTDEERSKFVEQFWDRRNPDPGNKENKFKEELYRRLAFANEHFASANPGWKTDRGGIYIMYGPPDEIDSHPENKPYAFETWKYKVIDGIGRNLSLTFTGSAVDGELKLWSDRAIYFHPLIQR